MPIVGTAGHVDHGKSTLVQALTGTDPDRWDEEKQRGLTIDLGFASATIGGHDIGFVDVPGHERFIRNMLAGVVGVDCALLVVAADSGWMPQTEEHVRILDLVRPPRGIIALTRTDLVDAETVELATLELAEEVAGTRLESWPVVPVSAVTGDGLDELRNAIATELDAEPQAAHGSFRLWVDRSFSIRGAGVVVTGTVQRGTVSVDDEVEVMPSGQVARVRGIQRHDRPVESATAGTRAAINLGKIDLDDVARGMLITQPGTATPSTRAVVRWESGRGFDDLPQRGAFHIHSGTADTPASIRKLSDSLVLVSTDEPIPAVCGDRVIIREAGRQAVVGGGEILDPRSPRRITGRTREVLMAETDPATRMVGLRGVIDHEEMLRATGGLLPDSGIRIGTSWTTQQLLTDTSLEAIALVRDYHGSYPKRPGIPIAELSTRLGLSRDFLQKSVSDSDELTVNDGFVSSSTFTVRLDEQDEDQWEQAKATLEASYGVPRASALGLDDELLHALIRQGSLVQIEPDLVFTAEQLEQLELDLDRLPEAFTVSQFGEHFGTARRQSVPLLEWFDARGITKRSGDTRSLRRQDD